MNTLYRSIIIFLLLLNSCKNNSDTVETPDQVSADPELIFVSHEQFEHSGMELGTLSDYTFDKSVQTTGVVDVPPQYRAKVSAKMGGFIKETLLLEGDRVKRGQFLASIENPEFVEMQQSYLEVRERLNYLKSEYERQRTLYDEKIISEKSYLKAESEFKSAQARMTGLKKQLQLLNISISNVDKGIFSSVARIYAPIAGNISEINVTKGSPVSPETVILEIVDNSHLHIEMAVFEKDILFVKKGQQVRFRIPETGASFHEAEVHLVGTTIEPNRTITVHGHPKDESLTLLPGMFVSAEILIDSMKAPGLPSTALMEVNDQDYVLKLKSKTDEGYEFMTVAVIIDESNEDFVSFQENEALNSESQFLIKGGYALMGE
ncbi:MAG: efflux RND transporter periplasmic adaptor subunit [Flavobacteriaceae bacterium]|nr:efflux RND transporter periplasmic adaptor subunit [Flavobacteriaceae bacterium]